MDVTKLDQKTNSQQNTGHAKLGKDMKIEEVLNRLEKHESECNLRYQFIEEKLNDNKKALKNLDFKLWGLAVLILVSPVIQKFIG